MPDLTEGVGVVIPNYNGEAFIIPTVEAAITSLGNLDSDGKIYVIDDASEDGSREVLDKAFSGHPQVQLLVRKENGGFGEACATGFNTNVYSTVLLLNSDVLIEKDAIGQLWGAISKPENHQVFAITGNFVDEKGQPVDASLASGKFHFGLMRVRYSQDVALRAATQNTLYASGGFSLFRTRLFEELGGFSPIFKPFYCEDLDISLRAQSADHPVLYLPGARAQHAYSKTIRRHFPRNSIKTISRANRLLLVWIHMDTFGLWARHILSLMLRLLGALVSFDRVFLAAFAQAIEKVPQVRKERAKVRPKKFSLIQVLKNSAH